MEITVHLLRHGEVFNPEKVIYERLPGFHLSDKGQQMAQRVADFIQNDSKLLNITKIVSSPLQRTLETANPVRIVLPNASFTTDERFIEVSNKIPGQNLRRYCLENLRRGHFLRVLRLIYNPLLPSWGEHSKTAAKRMYEGLKDHAFDGASDGDQILIVSHQRAIWALKRLLTKKSLLIPPRYRKDVRLCSISSFTFEVDNGQYKLINTAYIEPAKELY